MTSKINFQVDLLNKKAVALSQMGDFVQEGYQFSFQESQNILIDNKFNFINVIKVVFLFNELKYIIFTNDKDENTFCYDLLDNALLFKEKLLSHEILNPGSIFNVPSNLQVNDDISVIDDENINLFFSTSNAISEIVLLEEIAKKEDVTVIKEDNFFNDDVSNNYCVKINKNNVELIEYIMYLIYEGCFLPIQIYGAPIDKAYRYLLSKTSSKTTKVYNDNFYSNLPTFESIIQKYNDGVIDSELLITQIVNKYPPKVVKANYSSYSLQRYGKDKYFYGAFNNKDMYQILHNDVVMRLKEDNKIPAKWHSEFELYLQVKKIFSQAVFQYRADWLGLQSLDIYIPNKKIAIEYQGVQHYEPIEFFGGIDAFEHRIKLDAQKRELCEKQGVKLIYWRYDELIEQKAIKKKIKECEKA